MNRIEPNLPSSAYTTYSIDTPTDLKVPAACAQVGCEAHLKGWETAIDESTDLGKQQAAYIRTKAKRTFIELRTAEGLTVFRFDSGQRCFQEHFTRPEIYSVRQGDWRQTFGDRRRHASAAEWVEDFGEHQLHLAETIEKG